jgi:tRNA G18 (ribose-2'-O)-methylase SpoU
MRKLANSELNRKSIEEFKEAEKMPCVVVLDNVRSLNNIGSVFRTSDAFLVSKIFLCGITATPPHREIQKSALGATESVDWQYFTNTVDAVEQLRNEGFIIYSIEQVDKSIKLKELSINPDSKIALVFGHEIKGVAEGVIALSDHCIEIDQFGTKHSLNISVCAGVVIWEMFKKFDMNRKFLGN